jgi:DNA primase
VRGALATAEDVPGGADSSPQRPNAPRPNDQTLRVGLEILGALLDHSQLLDSPELSESAGFLEGDIAAAVAAARSTMTGHPVLAIEQFLAKIPGSIHSFAASRLAAPLYEKIEDARAVLLQNVTKLSRLEQTRRKNEAISALQRAAAAGDFDTELELLKQQQNLAQQRHGVGER